MGDNSSGSGVHGRKNQLRGQGGRFKRCSSRKRSRKSTNEESTVGEVLTEKVALEGIQQEENVTPQENATAGESRPPKDSAESESRRQRSTVLEEHLAKWDPNGTGTLSLAAVAALKEEWTARKGVLEATLDLAELHTLEVLMRDREGMNGACFGYSPSQQWTRSNESTTANNTESGFPLDSESMSLLPWNMDQSGLDTVDLDDLLYSGSGEGDSLGKSGGQTDLELLLLPKEEESVDTCRLDELVLMLK